MSHESARSSRPDGELLRGARHDPEAFCLFYRRHAKAVYGFFLRSVGDAETANDLTAETFAQALRGLTRFRGADERSAGAWLFGIAQNLLRQYYRRDRVASEARRKGGMRSAPTRWPSTSGSPPTRCERR